LKTHTLEFHNEDDGTLIKMTIGAGHPDLNEFFRAAAMNYIAPNHLAMQMGKLSEERKQEILMRAYACGVVVDCEPEMSEEAVYRWFKKHPKEFDILFGIADHRKNFEDDGNPYEHGTAGPTPAEGVDGAG
jgi:hypothetical protein